MSALPMAPRKAASWLAVVLVAGGACSRGGDVRTAVARLQTVGADTARRPLAELDVMGDGDIDADDARLIERLAAGAKKLADDNQIALAPQQAFYQGPAAGEAPVLSFLRAGDTAFDLSAVPLARLRELAIESRWLALQTRLAAAAGEAPGSGPVGGMLRERVPGYHAEEMEPAAICDAVAKADLAAYRQAGLPATVIMDLDSTVWAGNGTDVFLASLIELGLPRAEGNAPVQAFLKTLPKVDAAKIDEGGVLDSARLLYERATDTQRPEAERVSAKDAFYNIVALMRGMSPDEARRAAQHAIEVGALGLPPWRTRIYADRDGCGMGRLVELLVERGYEVYLLSATPDVMVQAAAVMLKLPIERAFGSALELEAGRYTGKVRDNTYTVKGPITRQWLPSPPFLAFGDSPTSDFGMLVEAAGAGFMVNPRAPFLERDAKEAQARLVSVSFDGTEGDLARPQ